MKLDISSLRGKKIGFLGLGKSNLALLNSLPLDGCEVVLRSDGAISKNDLPLWLKDYKIYEKEAALCNIDEDILFLSPSVKRSRRELKEAEKKRTILSSDAELFFENNEKPIYAVTGSDGKSTTATILSMLLSEKGVKLIGNVGVPMSPALFEDHSAFVCEISSFMLSHTVPKSRRAAVTNITPNHLDYHGSFEEYTKAKLSLLDRADEKIINFDDEILASYARSNKIFAITSTRLDYATLKSLCPAEIYLTLRGEEILLNGEMLLKTENVRRSEPHNLKNLMTAVAISYGDVSKENIRQIAKCFGGLAHRCEFLENVSGVDFYNSSIDSTPSRTAETLRSLNRKAVTILGGRGKGTPYEILFEPLKKHCHTAVIYGEDAEKIHHAIRDACRTLIVDGFDEAVTFAYEIGRACGTVLLSPAATSYDQFKNYEERGERFKEIIKNLQF